MANPRGPGGESSGGPSLGDCGNICEENLVFRVIFRKFMHRWFQICAQLGSDNVSFLHYRPPKLKYGFFRGSFSQPTSKSKWVGEPDYIRPDSESRRTKCRFESCHGQTFCHLVPLRSPPNVCRSYIILQFTNLLLIKVFKIFKFSEKLVQLFSTMSLKTSTFIS